MDCKDQNVRNAKRRSAHRNYIVFGSPVAATETAQTTPFAIIYHDMSLPTPSFCSLPTEAELARVEPALIALAQASGGDPGKLLTAFFSFLHRRTDFYVVNEGTAGGPNIGFAPGHAEKILLASFRQFPLRRLAPGGGPPPAKAAHGKEDTKAKVEKKATKESVLESVKLAAGSQPPVAAPTPVRTTSEGLQVPIGNGGTTDKYTWTQSVDECTVLIPLKPGTRAKDLQVEIETKYVHIQHNNMEVLKGSWTHDIVTDESTWTIESDVLQLILQKRAKLFWDAILEGDDRIDIDLVDSTRHVSSYDESTQAQIRKLIFDQSQLRQGKPASDQVLQQEVGSAVKVPELPPRVEYIDRTTLDENMP